MNACVVMLGCRLWIGLVMAGVPTRVPSHAATQPIRAHPQADRVVIVANQAMPQSVRLAEYYARRRGVPLSHICRVRTTTSETIDRAGYRREILMPVRRFLGKAGFLTRRAHVPMNGAHYLVTVYGVPVRVSPGRRPPATSPKPKPQRRAPHSRPTSRPSTTQDRIGPAKARRAQRRRLSDAASVDSELTLLTQGRVPVPGVVRNPYFNQRAPFGRCMLRVKKLNRAIPLSSFMCLVTRLDGPSPEVVRRMIDDAIAAEKTGLAGTAYVDLRGLSKGAYAKGDRWIRGAADRLAKAGFHCHVENTGKLLAPDLPMPNAAVYLGWYTGQAYGRFLDPAFRFVPGAVAYHLHSFSAGSVRTDRRLWVGPLLARGAAVTIGHVYEPFLGLTTRVDVFIDRLLAGRNFAEAAYASLPALSWQSTCLGDPLYRPFATRRPVHTRPAGAADRIPPDRDAQEPAAQGAR